MDRSAERRFGTFGIGDYREILHRRFKIIGTTTEAASFTTAPIVFMDYGSAQERSEILQGRTSYVLVKTAPGATCGRWRRRSAGVCPFNDVHTRDEWARKSRSYWVVSTGLGMNMGVTVFLGILVGIVVVAQTLYTSAVEHVQEFGTGQGHRRLELGHLPDPRRAGAHLGRGGLRPGRAHLAGHAAADGEALPERARVAALRLRRLRGTVLMCLGAAMLSFRRVASIDPALVFRA
jgi:putative ABC transport system permease protein